MKIPKTTQTKVQTSSCEIGSIFNQMPGKTWVKNAISGPLTLCAREPAPKTTNRKGWAIQSALCLHRRPSLQVPGRGDVGALGSTGGWEGSLHRHGTTASSADSRAWRQVCQGTVLSLYSISLMCQRAIQWCRWISVNRYSVNKSLMLTRNKARNFTTINDLTIERGFWQIPPMREAAMKISHHLSIKD